MNPACLERQTSVVLHGREKDIYKSIDEMKDALAKGEVGIHVADISNEAA